MNNTATRVLVACVAIPGIVLLAYLGGYFWFSFVAAIFIFSILEYRLMIKTHGARPQTASMIAGGLFLMLVFMHERLRTDVAGLFNGDIPLPIQWQTFIWIAILLAIFVPAVELFRKKDSALLNLSATFFGIFYLGICLGTTVGIREIFSIAEFPVARFFGTIDLSPAQSAQLGQWGAFTMISILATIWICDTAAYFGGLATGKHKLFERVSPKKTWEGAIWGIAGAMGAMIVAKYLILDYLPLAHAIVIGIMIGTIGQVGDLIESLLKRDAKIKDSSSLIPGHGGVFDRFDSMIYVSPAIFLYLDFVVFA